MNLPKKPSYCDLKDCPQFASLLFVRGERDMIVIGYRCHEHRPNPDKSSAFCYEFLPGETGESLDRLKQIAIRAFNDKRVPTRKGK